MPWLPRWRRCGTSRVSSWARRVPETPTTARDRRHFWLAQRFNRAALLVQQEVHSHLVSIERLWPPSGRVLLLALDCRARVKSGWINLDDLAVSKTPVYCVTLNKCMRKN